MEFSVGVGVEGGAKLPKLARRVGGKIQEAVAEMEKGVEEANDVSHTIRQQDTKNSYEDGVSPKKRAFFLAAFLAFLTVLTLLIQTIFAFMSSLSKNKDLWKSLEIYVRNQHNHNKEICDDDDDDVFPRQFDNASVLQL